MTIAVPVGKRFKITDRGWSQRNIKVSSRGIQSENHFGADDIWVDEWDENWDNESFSYDRGVEYRMTADGLEKIKSDKDASDDDND
jgi:hypothetical protein